MKKITVFFVLIIFTLAVAVLALVSYGLTAFAQVLAGLTKLSAMGSYYLIVAGDSVRDWGN